jgi:magnesium chelatase family protein
MFDNFANSYKVLQYSKIKTILQTILQTILKLKNMITKIKTLTHFGLSVLEVDAECHVMNGNPIFNLVGMAEKSVIESRERIRVVINELSKQNKDIRFPLSRITVNLAPAEVVKRGNQYDLAILLSLLSFQGIIGSEEKSGVNKCIFLGELSMDGNIKKISNIVNYCLYIKQKLKDYKVFVPEANSIEASYLTLGNIYAVSSVAEIISELNNPGTLKPIEKQNPVSTISNQNSDLDMSDIIGQKQAKRALEISAAGSHNVIMIGEAGSGKTLLSKALTTILPDLSENELMEVAKIRSLAGASSEEILDLQRPFRSPHHSCSAVSLLGGGKRVDPGEVTKSHFGVLFLDELTEFDRKTLDSLRQPLEDRVITVARAIGSVTYPCSFQLIATMNPSFSGGFDSGEKGDMSKNSGMKKISGPILDRIDLQLRIFKPKNIEILNKQNISEKSLVIKDRVKLARIIQEKRQGKSNAELSVGEITKFCNLDEKTTEIMSNFMEAKNISMRSFHKILKVARTIADLDKKENIGYEHVIEAVQFRF